MKFTVTPLGGGRADTARVVDSIVRYLQPPAPKGRQPSGASPSVSSGPERYYADAGEEPGRWLGRSARAAGLAGAVDRDDFASPLAGRDPHHRVEAQFKAVARALRAAVAPDPRVDGIPSAKGTLSR